MAGDAAPDPVAGWVPVPDPTRLTTEAVDKATAQFRLETGALREILETRLGGVEHEQELIWAGIRGWPGNLDTRLDLRRQEFLGDLKAVRELLEQRLDDLDKAIRLAAGELAKIPAATEQERAKLDSETTRRLTAEREYILSQIGNARAETQRVADVALEKFEAIDGTFASNALALTAALAAQKEAAAEAKKSSDLAIDKSERATQETIRANAVQSVTSTAAQAAIIADLKDRVVRIESGATGAQGQRAESRLNLGSLTGIAVLMVAVISLILLYATKK